jgi:hypothetical protein
MISPRGAGTTMSSESADRSADSGIHFVGDKQTIRARRGQPIGDRLASGKSGAAMGARGYGPELMVAVRFET